MFWGDFIEIFCSLHPGGSRSRKISKKWKDFRIFKLTQNVFKCVHTCFKGIFFKFLFTSAPWRSKIRTKIEKNWIPESVQKRSEKFPNKLRTCFEVFFGKKILPSAPWVVETRKKYKKVEKLRNFQNSPKTFPKTLFEHVLLDYFDGKKLHPVNPGDSKKSTRIEKTSNFQKCPKTFPRLSKHVLMWFFRDFLASAPWRVETSKNFKEMQKLLKIQDTQTRFQKCPNKFWTCFEVFSRKKKCPVHPGGSKLGKT